MKSHNHHHHGTSAVEPSPAPTTKANQTRINVTPSREEVARKAYHIYLNQGCPQGREVQHWLEAETQVLATAKAK